MAFNLNKASSTLTAVIGTEHTLLTENTSGIFVLFAQLKNLAAGEAVELRAYVKVLTGDANPLLVYGQTFAGKQGDGVAAGSKAGGAVIVKSPPIESPFSLIWTLVQVNGVGRVFDWREDQLA